MIDEDLVKTQSKLDSIRARRPKFVCVNDDVKEANEELGKILHDFYESFFAVRSRFELPEGTRNEYLRLDVKAKYESRGKTCLCFLGVVLVVLFVLSERKYFLERKIFIFLHTTTNIKHHHQHPPHRSSSIEMKHPQITTPHHHFPD